MILGPVRVKSQESSARLGVMQDRTVRQTRTWQKSSRFRKRRADDGFLLRSEPILAGRSPPMVKRYERNPRFLANTATNPTNKHRTDSIPLPTLPIAEHQAVDDSRPTF